MFPDWTSIDTAVAATAAVAAMSCAVPGVFLVLRRQSMMGDALSHTALPGIVVAFLAAHAFELAGWGSGDLSLQFFLMIGAVLAGVLTACLTEAVKRWGGVESSAALGVVYTSLFAAGLLMVRLFADAAHLDAECILFGAVETVVLDTVGDTLIPRAAVFSGLILLMNLVLAALCLKELRVATFDPSLAASQGISPALVDYALMIVASVTLVAAFRSVGSILVVTVLVAPAATAWLLTSQLHRMLLLTLLIAGGSAVLGHALALAFPELVLQRIGLTAADDTSTSGMIALVCGMVFVIAVLISPRNGVVLQIARRLQLEFRIAREDILGQLYRREEFEQTRRPMSHTVAGVSWWLSRFAAWRLTRQGHIVAQRGGPQLTESGRALALRLVRSHRLWESYMARHFPLPDDHLHETAHRVEHFLDEPLLSQLEAELDRPDVDPHGRQIPSSELSIPPGDAVPTDE